MINSSSFEFNKQTKTISISSEAFSGGFPRSFEVVSDSTGQIVKFFPITEDDPKFDQDCWDGELAYYAPSNRLPNCKYAVIYHSF